MAEREPKPAPDPFANVDLSATGTAAIGVPGKLIPTGQPGGSIYTGYQAEIPNSYTADFTADFGNIFAGTFNHVPPRYFDGDQYAPAASLSVDELIDLQNSMDAAGLYDTNARIVPGVWTDDDMKAYTRALAGANQTGTDSKTYIQRLVTAAPSVKAKERQPLVVSLTNPDTIRNAVRNVSQSLYGGDLPSDEVDRFVSAYQGLESTAANQAYAMSAPGAAGGSVTAPPSPSDFAEETIRREHPDQVAVTQFGNAMEPILNTLRQSA